ncbi:GNAT family N-acetyltransferase [Pseudomonas sp. DY-1]|nr:GNAT family N-acetyltransferase [Pseudomonas sp. DY-1]
MGQAQLQGHAEHQRGEHQPENQLLTAVVVHRWVLLLFFCGHWQAQGQSSLAVRPDGSSGRRRQREWPIATVASRLSAGAPWARVPAFTQDRMPMSIRKLRISDIEALHRLFAEVSAEGEYLLRAEAPPLEQMRALLLRSLPLDLPQFVVDAEGDLVGSIEIFPASLCQMEDASGEDFGVLGMQVRKTHRGRGLGSQLMEAALEHCRRQDMRRVELTVLKSNEAAIRLYQRFAFHWVEDLPPVTLPNGRPDQPQKMRLLLD